MSRAYLGVGSNVDRERNIASCLNALRRRFGELTVSPIYRCPAVGFDGDDFYNLAVGVDTDLEPEALVTELHAIEAEHGRTRQGPKFSDRTLDIDLLLFDDRVQEAADFTLPRPEILERAFVLRPLADIAPELVHPVERRTMEALWNDFPGAAEDIRPVDVVNPG